MRFGEQVLLEELCLFEGWRTEGCSREDRSSVATEPDSWPQMFSHRGSVHRCVLIWKLMWNYSRFKETVLKQESCNELRTSSKLDGTMLVFID